MQVLFSENSAVWLTHKLQICNSTQQFDSRYVLTFSIYRSVNFKSKTHSKIMSH